MRRFRLMLSLFVAFAGFAAWNSSANAQTPFGLFPEKTPIVVKVPGLDAVEQKVGAFLKTAFPDKSEKLMKQLKEGLKQATDGRDLKGLDKAKPIYVLLPNLAELTGNENPNVALIVPVLKYDDFKTTFKADELKTLKKEDGLDVLTIEEKPLYLLNKGETVVLSSQKEYAKEYSGKFTSLKGKVSAEVEASFTNSDFCIFVNMIEINNLYGAQIKGAKSLVDLALAQGGAAGGLDKKQLELAKDMILGVFQILEDSKAILVGLSLKGEGVSLKIQSQFTKDTDTSAFLKDLKPTEMAKLGALPDGKGVYSAMQLSAKSKLLSKLIQMSTADDSNEDVKAKLEKAAEALQAAGQIDTVSFADLAPISGITMNSYENGEAAFAAQMQMYNCLTETSSFGSTPLKSKPAIKENAEKVGALSFTSVKMKFDFDKAIADQNIPEEAKESMKAVLNKLMGGDGMSMWLARDDKSVLQVTAKDWESAKKQVESYLSLKAGSAKKSDTVGDSAAYKLTRNSLPKDVTFLTLIESNSLLNSIYGYVKEIPKMIPGADALQIPELKIDKNAPKSFFGLSVTLKPEHGGFDLFVPSQTIKTVADVVKPLMNQGD